MVKKETTEIKNIEMGQIEQVLVMGDLQSLSPTQRAEYYSSVCISLGLNPLTKPFDYIMLNGKLRLYALKDATEQLRKIYKVSILSLTRVDMGNDMIAFCALAQDGTGRTDSSIGAVSTINLKGEALANAWMKAETKAKRRVTLSICGLGMLDETEVDSVPGAITGDFSREAPLQKAHIVQPSQIAHESSKFIYDLSAAPSELREEWEAKFRARGRPEIGFHIWEVKSDIPSLAAYKQG